MSPELSVDATDFFDGVGYTNGIDRFGGDILVVYLDVVIFLNFAVDFLLLLGVNRFTGHPDDITRCLWGAVVGGIYAGVCLIPEFAFLGRWYGCLACVILVALIAYGYHRSTIRRGTLFYLLSMALGGIALCMDHKSFTALIIAAGGLYLVCLYAFRDFPGARRLVKVKLTRNGSTYHLIALVDTGNTLVDPISGTQVLVAGPKVAGDMLRLTRSQLTDPVQTLQTANIPGLRLLPYRTVGQGDGLMLGIRMDSVEIDGHKSGSFVAFSPVDFGNDEAYQALTGGI